MKKLIALFLTFVTIIAVIVPTALTASATINMSTYNSKVQEFINDSRWKNGLTWADGQTPKLSSYSSWGCCAYTADFVAYVYGSKSYAWNTSDFTRYTNINDIKAGDIINLGPEHWFVVINRDGDTLYTAEGNFSDKTRITNNGWKIHNGKIRNIAAANANLDNYDYNFDFGYHYNFSSTDEDDKTTPLSENTKKEATISIGGEFQYFSYTPTTSRDYVIYSTGTEDTFVYLYDANGNQISSDDDGGENYNFRLQWYLEANTTYTFGIKYYDSSKTGTINFVFGRTYIISYDANGGTSAPASQTKDYAEDLILSSAVPTREGYRFVGWANSATATTATYQPGDTYAANTGRTVYAVWEVAYDSIKIGSHYAEISNEGESKRLSFTPAMSSTYLVYATGDEDTKITLYDSNGNQLARDDDSGLDLNFRLEYYLEKDTTYFFEIKYYSATKTGSIPFNLGTMRSINNGSNTALLRYENTMDYFTFTPSFSGKYVIYSNIDSDTEVYFFDWENDKFLSDDDGGSDCNFRLELDLVEGITYAFGIKFHNNDEAGLLPFVFRGYFPMKLGTNTADILKEEETAYFNFVPSESGTYLIYSNEDSDTKIALLDKENNEIASDDDSGDGNNFCLEYYLEAGQSYDFAVNYYDSTTGTIEFKLEKKLTLLMGLNYADITEGEATVYFNFTPSESGNYAIYSIVEDDPLVRLYDDSGVEIASNDDCDVDNNFYLKYYLEKGKNYTYAVSYWSTSATGTIEFKFEKTIDYDINDDGKFNMFDYVSVKNCVMKGTTDEALKARSDVNGDGKVNMFDYVLVKSAYFAQ